MTTGRKIWNIIFPVLLFLLITTGVSFAMTIGALLASGYDISTVSGTYQLITSLAGYIAALVVFLFLYLQDRRMFSGECAVLTPAGILVTLAVCLAASLALQIFLNYSGIYELFPAYEEIYDTYFAGQPLPLLIVTVAIVGPIEEELLFRGIVFKRLLRYTGKRALSIVASAVIFGAVHMNMAQFIYATAIGILFAVFYDRYQNIMIPISAHIAVNLLSVLLG